MKFFDLFKNWNTTFDKAGKVVQDLVDTIEDRIERRVRRAKKMILATMFQFLFLAIGVVLLLAGIIMLVGRYFSWDVVLIVAGIVCLYVAMMFKWMR